jgi:hypothetical protein
VASFCSTSISPIGLPMLAESVASAGTNQRVTVPSLSGGKRNTPQSACTLPTVSPWKTLPLMRRMANGCRSAGE